MAGTQVHLKWLHLLLIEVVGVKLFLALLLKKGQLFDEVNVLLVGLLDAEAVLVQVMVVQLDSPL